MKVQQLMNSEAIVRILAVVLSLFAVQIARAQEDVAFFGTENASEKLLVRSTTDIAAFAPLLDAFAKANPDMAVLYEQWGSIDLFGLSASDCELRSDAADLVISSAIDLQTKLVNDGCARAYQSTLTRELPDARNWRGELFGLTFEPAVIIYNRDILSEADIPRSRFDLIDSLRPTDSVLAGKVATYDIEASGLGYLFAFIDSQQANTFGRLIESFGRSGAVATCCSAGIIDAVAEGTYFVGYNVLGSYALSRAENDPRIGVLAPSDYTLILSRGAFIPQNASNPDGAQRLIDFTLSPDGEAKLRETNLIVSFGEEGDRIELPGRAKANLRPIQLSPRLLVGLDQHKRQIFLQLWRDNLLPKAP